MEDISRKPELPDLPKSKSKKQDRNVKFVAKLLLTIIVCNNIGELTQEKNHSNVKCAQRHSHKNQTYQTPENSYRRKTIQM
jgi:ribosomal protein L32